MATPSPEYVSDQNVEKILACQVPLARRFMQGSLWEEDRKTVLDLPKDFQFYKYGRGPRYNKFLAAMYDEVYIIDVNMYQMVAGSLKDGELLITWALASCTGLALRFVPKEKEGADYFALGHFVYDACDYARTYVGDICLQKDLKIASVAASVRVYHATEVLSLIEEWQKVFPDLEIKLIDEERKSQDIRGLVVSRNGGRLLNLHQQSPNQADYYTLNRWVW